MFVNYRRKFVLLGRVGFAKHLGFRMNKNEKRRWQALNEYLIRLFPKIVP